MKINFLMLFFLNAIYSFLPAGPDTLAISSAL